MFLTIQDLKVDQTVLASDERSVLVTNINIPQHELVNLDNILDRVTTLISTSYINVQNVMFQVCATYELRNSTTGDIRQWTGSFNPSGNQANTLNQFEYFSPNFKQVVTNACSEGNIYRKLRFYHVQTNWVFNRITSVIIAVQAVVQNNHPTLIENKFLSKDGRGRRRANQSFLLP